MKRGPYETKDTRRLPFEPLAEICAARFYSGDEQRSGITDIGKVAAMLGLNAHTARRWKIGGLSDLQADRAAIALGLHPLDVWPDFYDDIDTEVAA